jgi:hypothetical protein
MSMFHEKEKSTDWMHEDEEARPSPPRDPFEIEDDSEETKDEKYQNPNIPQWMKDELLTSAAEHNEINNKNRPKSTIKYRKPNVSKKQQEETHGNWCCTDDPVIYWFRIFHSLCGSIGVLALISNIYVLIDVPLDIRNIVIHIYAIPFCLIVIGAELELQMLKTRLQFLESWILRGFFYFFVGSISGNTLFLPCRNI